MLSVEHFIHNTKNAFPLALAREAARPQQEPAHNPLIYYGKSGSGKTHLLRAIADALSTLYGRHTVFYGNTAHFLQADARQGNGVDSAKYQAYCLDDLHLCAKNFPLQEKLLCFLDTCQHGKRQVVCTCAGPPGANRDLAESLRSRLERGLIVELKNPDLDVRMRFAQSQCDRQGIDLTREHMLLLARRCEHLRFLSDSLSQIAAHARLAEGTITRQDIEHILKNSGEHGPVTPQDIIRRVAHYFSLPTEEITTKTRKPALVFARQTAMYLCREILGISYPALGQIFGGKDHSTVIYSTKKIKQYILAHKNAHTKITELAQVCMQRSD